MRIAVAGGTGTVGRHVVEVLRERGHDPVVLARSTGVDVVSGTGLATALAGADAVVDVLSTATRRADASRAFFGATTRRLLEAEQATGVGHHLLLGIVGSQNSDYGYYAGKQLQEQLIRSSPVPWTELRATQFHEFAGQILDAATFGPLRLTPRMVSQPIAAREVAERLVDLATASPGGLTAELAGPRVERMARMVRAYATATGIRGPIIEIPLPGTGGRSMRDGTLLPGPDAILGRQTFDGWLSALTNTPNSA